MYYSYVYDLTGIYKGTASMEQEPRLLDRVRASIRTKHYSIRTDQAYVDWIRRFILFHG